MKRLKIVVIGAGSAQFGRGMIVDVLACQELRDYDVTFSLVDINKDALNLMFRFAQKVKENFSSPVEIQAETDRIRALPGADYVVVSVAQNRWDLWEKDFYIPIAYGFKHVYGENGGPGAAFHTLRSLHLMIPICRDMERLCPEALLMNFTNPESRVCLAISRFTSLRAVGLCHGPVSTLKKTAEILGRRPEDIDLTVGGINHFHWVLGVADRSGNDLFPEFQQRLKDPSLPLDVFTRKMVDVFGLLTYPAPSHPEEYVPYAFHLTGPYLFKWGIGRIARRPGLTIEDREFTIEGEHNQPSYEVWCAEQAKVIAEAVEGTGTLQPEILETTEELALPLICDIVLDRKRKELSGNVVNRGGLIANLPEDAIVEVPLMADAGGIHPIAVGPIPEGIAGICRLQISIQNLLVDAYQERSKRLLLQALLLEPVVDDVDRAEEMMEVMIKAQGPYLPEMR